MQELQTNVVDDSVYRWDQGEADAKRTNTTWYATEFPRVSLQTYMDCIRVNILMWTIIVDD